MKRRYSLAAAGAVVGVVLVVGFAGSGQALPKLGAASAHGRGHHHSSAPATTTPTAAASASATATAGASATGGSMPGMDMPSTSTSTASTGASATMTMPPTTFNPNLDPGESVTISPAVKGVAPDMSFSAPNTVTHHEFQATCSQNHSEQSDPIVYPKKAGVSHMHTFMGSTTTNPDTTTKSLLAGDTSCANTFDHSAYWVPSLYDGDKLVTGGNDLETIYYKSGVSDYRTVRPFPNGLRFVVGSPTDTKEQFQNLTGTVNGFECGDIDKVYDFPVSCPAGTDLNVRLQAPSCWDGVNLDVADHKSNMAYPVYKDYRWICPTDHPVAVPMVEFKMHWKTGTDMSKVRFSSGAGYSYHYDVFVAWDQSVLSKLVTHCINGGMQCDTYGYDESKDSRGTVLPDPRYKDIVAQFPHSQTVITP